MQTSKNNEFYLTKKAKTENTAQPDIKILNGRKTKQDYGTRLRYEKQDYGGKNLTKLWTRTWSVK